ncbi:MAG: hypothetical protein AAFV19_11235 [Pseudomonadota bacterium]
MTAIRIAAIALVAAMGTSMAQAQSEQTFQGIEGEVTAPTAVPTTDPLISDQQALSFEIGRADPTEQSIITESSAARGDFFRSTIHSGRRAGSSGATGLTIFDRLLDLD